MSTEVTIEIDVTVFEPATFDFSKSDIEGLLALLPQAVEFVDGDELPEAFYCKQFRDNPGFCLCVIDTDLEPYEQALSTWSKSLPDDVVIRVEFFAHEHDDHVASSRVTLLENGESVDPIQLAVDQATYFHDRHLGADPHGIARDIIKLLTASRPWRISGDTTPNFAQEIRGCHT
jgi:hypothetical protein